MSGPIVVTGGTGHLGRHVVHHLAEAGPPVRVLSRRPRPPDSADGAATAADWAIADLRTGEGVAAATAGAEVVVHCATSYGGRRDVEVARTVVRAARDAGVGHLVLVSIVGIDRVPLGYYRNKLAAERLVERSGTPYTILRATQFHELVRVLLAAAARSPVLPVPDCSFQPVDARVVARRLAELALAPPAGRAPDLGGPRTQTAHELARDYLAATGRRRALLPVRPPGRAFRALRRGGNLAPGHETPGPTFAEYVAELSDARRLRYAGPAA